MRYSDVFIGNIIKVNNAEGFNEVGKYANNFCNYWEPYKENVVLVKMKDDRYIWIMDMDSFARVSLTNLGIINKFMATSPTFDGELIVDEESLVPYYCQDDKKYNKKCKIKSLRLETLLDPRIPGGIEY